MTLAQVACDAGGMTEPIRHKRGDTFRHEVTVTDDDTGSAVDLTGYGIASKVRNVDDGVEVADLAVVARVDASGKYTLEASSGTQSWPAARLVWDIQYTLPDGLVISTETMHIQCIADVTY